MKLFKLATILVCVLGLQGTAVSRTTLFYAQQEVRPSAVWGYMPPWYIPIYMPNGPYLITRGVGFQEIHEQGDRSEVACTGFVADEDRYIHGEGPMVMQSYGRRVGISLSGPSRADDPYISALYVDYFDAGKDIRPWGFGSLVLEANVAVPEVKLNPGDVGYVQYSILLEDTSSGRFVWWVWQVYDVRSNQPDEFVGRDVTPDGGDYAYVITTFKSKALSGDPLNFSTNDTLPGSAEFAHATWNTPTQFRSKVDGESFGNGINAVVNAYPDYASMSRDPRDYRLRAFYFYPEIFLGSQTSDARICAQSHGAILRTE